MVGSLRTKARPIGLWSGFAVLWLLIASLVLPAAAAAEGEEEPAVSQWDFGLAQSGGSSRGFLGRLASGAADRVRFGLGLDAFFEHQESLRITSKETAFTIRELRFDRSESGVLHGDPGLLNRKFDILWESGGAGVELPIVLPSLGGSVRSTLSLRAAAADVTLDFGDRTRPQDSTSLGGRGALFGAELEVVSSLCRDCPWFTQASLRFEKLPSFTVDRSPAFAPQGFEILEDEVRLDREVQEISGRVGYRLAGNPVSYYIGGLYRRTDLEIEDELRYRDPLRATETRLSSSTRLESDAVLGLAGVEYRMGERLESRLETSLGEEDWGVVLRVVYRPWSKDTRLDHVDAFALSVAPLLAQIEAEFRNRREALTVVPAGPGETAYITAEVEGLLDWTKARLFEVLYLEELAPLRDSIQFRFDGFRRDLGSLPPAAGAAQPTPGARSRIAFAASRLAQVGPGRILSSQVVGQVLKEAGALLSRLTGISRAGSFTLWLCVDSVPRGAKFLFWSPMEPQGSALDGNTARRKRAVRGRYSYKISDRKSGRELFRCPDPTVFRRRDEPAPQCLDLLYSDGDQLVECDVGGKTCEPRKVLVPPETCPPS